MKLNDLIYQMEWLQTKGDTALDVHALQFDSRKVQENDVFFAVSGSQADGHAYIEKAIENGATAIVYEDNPAVFSDDVTYVKVADANIA